MGALAVSSGGVTVISDKMIGLGLAKRTKSAEARRAVYLEITDHGRERLPVVEAEWNEVMDRVFLRAFGRRFGDHGPVVRKID